MNPYYFAGSFLGAMAVSGLLASFFMSIFKGIEDYGTRCVLAILANTATVTTLAYLTGSNLLIYFSASSAVGALMLFGALRRAPSEELGAPVPQGIAGRTGQVLYWLGVLSALGWLFTMAAFMIGSGSDMSATSLEQWLFIAAIIAIPPAVVYGIGWAARYILTGRR